MASVSVDIVEEGTSYRRRAIITVVEPGDTPVSGAAVEGTWRLGSGSIGMVTGTTDESGQAVLRSSSDTAASGDVFELTVEGVTLDGYTYAPESVDQGSAPIP